MVPGPKSPVSYQTAKLDVRNFEILSAYFYKLWLDVWWLGRRTGDREVASSTYGLYKFTLSGSKTGESLVR